MSSRSTAALSAFARTVCDRGRVDFLLGFAERARAADRRSEPCGRGFHPRFGPAAHVARGGQVLLLHGDQPGDRGAQRFERLLRLLLGRRGVADGHLVRAAPAGRRVAPGLAVARLEVVAQHGPGGEAQRLQVERRAFRRLARGRLVRPGPDFLPFLVRAALDEEGHLLKREIVLGRRRHGELRGQVRG